MEHDIFSLFPRIVSKTEFSLQLDTTSRSHEMVWLSLAWPDPFRPGAYRLEIISAGLQGSGTVHSIKTNRDHQTLVGDDWKHVT